MVKITIGVHSLGLFRTLCIDPKHCPSLDQVREWQLHVPLTGPNLKVSNSQTPA